MKNEKVNEENALFMEERYREYKEGLAKNKYHNSHSEMKKNIEKYEKEILSISFKEFLGPNSDFEKTTFILQVCNCRSQPLFERLINKQPDIESVMDSLRMKNEAARERVEESNVKIESTDIEIEQLSELLEIHRTKRNELESLLHEIKDNISLLTKSISTLELKKSKIREESSFLEDIITATNEVFINSKKVLLVHSSASIMKIMYSYLESSKWVTTSRDYHLMKDFIYIDEEFDVADDFVGKVENLDLSKYDRDRIESAKDYVNMVIWYELNDIPYELAYEDKLIKKILDNCL